MQDLTLKNERHWHSVPAEVALAELKSSPQGLSAGEAAKRLEADGPNRLPAGRPRSVFARVFAQFNNLLIYVLIASALVTILLRHTLDAVVILAVVLINAAIGFIQEGRAEKSLEAIRAMLTPESSVLRDGRRLTVPAESLVAGDVVLAEAGDRIPADLRLLRATSLKIEEAVLTGEAAASDKAVDPVAPDAALGDRASMAYSGTMVASGQGAGLVVATGASTELGRISAMVGGVETLTTPLIRQMNVFAQRLTIVILALAACVCVFAFMARGYEIEHAFMAAVGVAVSAIPEGLPAVMTITLAIGVKRMAERNAIIRSLPAVETLGRGVDDLLGQDRHADLEPDDGRRGPDRIGRVRDDWDRLRAARRIPSPRRSGRPSRRSRSCGYRAGFSPLQRRLVETVGRRVDRRRRSDGGRADRLRDEGRR